MKRFILSVLVATALFPALVPAKQANIEAIWLSEHNAARADYDVPALQWSDALAADARKWAKHLASTGGFRHSGQNGQGENLWRGTKGYSAREMVALWVDEQRYYNGGRIPDVSTTGNFADVGHFTQIIWRTTKQVGCALADGRRDQVLVCRYYPAGNVMGENALTATAAKIRKR